MHDEGGWTFLETLIVIAVVLLLTATVGFMASGSLEKARRAAAQSQIDSFCVALESYYIDCGRYPTEEQGLQALRSRPSGGSENERWSGPYIHKNPPSDPWGNKYEYRQPGPDGSGYGIRSFGADGKEGGENADADISTWE